MSGQPSFTAGRENAFNDAIQNIMSQFGVGGSWHDNSSEYRAYAAAIKHRDRPHYSVRAPGWFLIPRAHTPELERGRRVAKRVALDYLAEVLRSVYGKPVVVPGGAASAKPDEELRRKIRLFKDIQATREAAFEYTGKGEYGGRDVPARLGLGGLQDFTPSVKTPTSARRATLRGGHTRRPPDSCFRSSRFSMSTVITYP
jgi:hypothetical protein